ncbi:MAG TPA: hypothetical protein VD997_02160 [Phycisphaerales bacterium]|nr:hypothetical protein [Phycisphaerales bacterium]
MKTPAFLRSGVPGLVLLLVALFVGVAAPSALAQTEPKKHESLKPPAPNKPDDPPIVWNYMAIVVVVALAGGAALIPSKRGHQD